ncbi:lamin tail domain-containing protein [Luteolibacter pohnpeiensis]|uniref:Lamin tail domain-containing protein n=1 Tax=Luteolibacter pohnpeiensis TaxID=454153 RepID=A0A934VV47_9BACT|nr:lamin tail domain-containing protein [Luteolibacter pohnpeiensis]MBK1881810.1 lamin tail domain-containing protein [Luteolibacter pohnpeiensis]
MKLKLALFSAVALAAAQSSKGALIISQYYEGSSLNKYIEITNTSSTSIDLGAESYYLALFSNGNREIWKTDGTPTATIALTGTIVAGETLVFMNAGAVDPSYASTTATTISSVNFNGDDSVVIYTGSSFTTASIVDVFGATASLYADTSYVRNADVLTGTTTDFDSAQWTQYSLADVANADPSSTEYLGTHVVIPEPASALLGALGLVGLLRRRR